MSRPVVLCVHGLWLTGIEFHFLRRRLRQKGWPNQRFRYSSISGNCDAHIEKLGREVRGIAEQSGAVPALVCHSLGGVIALRMLAQNPDLCPPALVLLGSPVNGSAVARQLRGRVLTRWLAGVCGDLLEQGAALRPDLANQTLSIVGDKPLGMGVLVGRPPKPHDGVVGVEEVRLNGAANLRLPVSHAGLVYQSRPIQAVVSWLAKHADTA